MISLTSVSRSWSVFSPTKHCAWGRLSCLDFGLTRRRLRFYFATCVFVCATFGSGGSQSSSPPLLLLLRLAVYSLPQFWERRDLKTVPDVRPTLLLPPQPLLLLPPASRQLQAEQFMSLGNFWEGMKEKSCYEEGNSRKRQSVTRYQALCFFGGNNLVPNHMSSSWSITEGWVKIGQNRKCASSVFATIFG